jgi:hypothetical protein
MTRRANASLEYPEMKVHQPMINQWFMAKRMPSTQETQETYKKATQAP